MSTVTINANIAAMVRRSADWCPKCRYAGDACLCPTDQPVSERSTVLRFMQTPSDPTVNHGASILGSAADYIIAELNPNLDMRIGVALCAAVEIITSLRIGQPIGGVLSSLSLRVQLDPTGLGYDYDNQAWVVNGKYEMCGHTTNKPCFCFGRAHAGENVRA